MNDFSVEKNKIFEFIDKFKILIFAIFSLIWFFPIFSVGLDNDSSRFVNIPFFPNTNTWDYWLHIFTSPINFNQYRPLSFFAIYQVFGGEFYQKIPWVYPLIGFGFYLGSLRNFELCIKNMKISFFATVLLMFAFVFQIGQVGLYSYSFSLKYFVPFFTITWFMKFLTSDDEFNWKNSTIMMLLLAVSITCHEGSFVFPGVLLFRLKRTNLKNLILIGLPSLGYLIMRLFVFGIPGQGAMGVDPSKILIPFSYYLNAIMSFFWFPAENIIEYKSEIIWSGVVALVISFGIAFLKLKRNKDKWPLFFLTSIIILLVPFCLIPKHVYFTRIIWIQFLFLLFMASLKGIASKKIFNGALTVLVALSIYPSWSFHKEYERKLAFHRYFKEEIKKEISGLELENLNQVLVSQDDLSSFYPFTLGILRQGIQELNLKRAIVFSVEASNKKAHLLINPQTYYFIKSCEADKCIGEDPYHLETELSLPKISNSTKIDLKAMYDSAIKRAYSE